MGRTRTCDDGGHIPAFYQLNYHLKTTQKGHLKLIFKCPLSNRVESF